MHDYFFGEHRLYGREDFSNQFKTLKFFLHCFKKDSYPRAQELDVFNKFKEAYKYCPYCGEYISEDIKHFFTEFKLWMA